MDKYYFQRDGKVKNLFAHMHTTVQALIVQAGATAPCSLFHDGRKVAYARSLRSIESVVEAEKEAEEIEVDIY